MSTNNQFLDSIQEIIDDQVKIFSETISMETVDSVPDTKDIPIQDPHKWIKVNDVICVFADMINSTQMSASNHDKSTASIYQLFTNTIIKIFNDFKSPYIDVKGDGVFALFDSTQPNTALAAAVTVKTFIERVFTPKVEKKTNSKVTIGLHIGIDQKTLLVRKMGLKAYKRTDRQNEVWAGKTVNMAAKLASKAIDKDLYVSDRFFKNLKDDKVLKCCECSEPQDLWEEVSVEDDDLFDFDTAYRLTSFWCEKHGKEYCKAIVDLDEE